MLVSIGEAKQIWAVGAVFGQARTLQRLHAELEPRLTGADRLVYLGNYMGYGAAVVETLDELLAFRRHLIERRDWQPEQFVALRGAQEDSSPCAARKKKCGSSCCRSSGRCSQPRPSPG